MLNRLKNQVALVAAYATAQGEFANKSAWDLGLEAFRGALSSSGISRDDIDGLFTQQAQDGSRQMESNRFGQMIGVDPKASGSLHYGTAGFTIAFAAAMIASGQCSIAACVYATNQRTSKHRFAAAPDPFGAPYGYLNPAGFAALGYQRYLHKYGRQRDRDLIAAIALTQRANATLNPIAFKREPMTLEQYLADRWIVWPLRRSDVCLINDGAVCLILADATRAGELTAKPVHLLGLGRQDLLRAQQHDDDPLVPHMKATAAQVYGRTGIDPSMIDALYVQDAHAPAVLFTLENYGFCADGEALDFIQGGRIAIDGELPINTSGGQLSEGYMVGWLHHVELFRQLRGEAGPRQVVDCRIAQFCATGGQRELTLSAIYGREPLD